MRILLTGAGGFVGASVASKLVGAGHLVTGTWHSNSDRHPDVLPSGLSLVQADLAEQPEVDALFAGDAGFDAIIHMAAVVAGREEDPEFPVRVTRANVTATANLIAAASRTGCGRFVFTSTISVYGNRGAPPGGYRETDAAPNTWYGWSKRAGENMLEIAAKSTGLTAVSLRLAGVHGRGRVSGALHKMTSAAIAGQDIIVSEPGSRFQWALVQDVSQAVRLACEADWPGGARVLNLASADSFTLAELAQRLLDMTGNGGRIDTSGATGRVRDETLNIDAAVRHLGYSPTTLGDFLPGYVAGMRNA